MLKKIIVLVLCIAPIMAFAQNKFGHINSDEVLSVMPERIAADKTLQDLGATFEKDLNGMRDEYNKKLKDFVDKRDSLPQTVLQARQSEIVELEQRINNTNQAYQNDFQKKRQDIYQPIIDKIKKAINDVGLENGFLYIFDLQGASILYHSDQSVDVLPLVKKKLNIK